jgi:hypothetical protein
VQSPSSSSSSKCCLIPIATLKTMSPAPPLHPLPPPGVAQVCNHPMLSYSSSSSSYEPGENIVRQCGKFLVLDRLLVKMKLSGHRCTLCMLRALACAVHACGCMSMPALCCVLRTHTYICIHVYMLSAASPARACTSFFAHSLPACLPALPAALPALSHAPCLPADPP